MTSPIFKKRTKSPDENNRYYIKTTYHGFNKCILINALTGSCLPNCTGYAYGRFMECQDNVYTCNLSRGNAENWYGYNDGYERGQTPKLGAVICWSDSAGAGHVAIVEKVYDNGDIDTSNSAYGGSYYYNKKLKKSNNYYMGRTYSFQGFIYNPTEFYDPNNPQPEETKPKGFNWTVFTKKIRERHKIQN